MVHQYSPDTPTTSLEKAYDDMISHVADTHQRNIIVNKALGKSEVDQSKVSSDIISLFNPHADFVNSYNERTIKENKRLEREKERQLYNEAGQAYEHLWKNDQFKKIHDPLSKITTNIDIFEKKGNYEDLAWKVFRDVDDSDVFLKVLYYPNLTKEDYSTLTNKFSDEYKIMISKKRFSYITALGATLFSWALAYRYRLKVTTFAFLTIGSALTTHCALNWKYQNKLKNNVNGYASSIANKYSDIKYLKINYTSTDKISKI